MALLASSSDRYRFKPRKPEDPRFLKSELPTAKTPEKVAVPVPVPMPRYDSVGEEMKAASRWDSIGEDLTATPRYKVNPGFAGESADAPNFDLFSQNPPAERGLTRDILKQPFPSTPPFADSASAPTTAADESAEPLPPALEMLRQREAELSAAENDPVKKEKWWRSMFKMMAQGAKDMPPAKDWGDLAYGAGRSLGSGAAGVIDRQLPGKIEQRYKIANAQRNVESAQKTAQAESQIQSRTDATRVRNARLGIAQTKAEQDKDRANRKAVSDDLKRLPYIDPTDPIHAKILERAKALGIDVDPESYGKGKNRPRIRVLDDDGVTVHWFEKDPAKGWTPIKIEGQQAVASKTDFRNPLTGETYTSEQRRSFASQKFDWQKTEAAIDNRRAERALALQAQGVEMRRASAQAEVEAIDDVLPGLESDYMKASTGSDADEYLAAQIQRAIATLKDRRGRASGTASVGPGASKSYKYTEVDVRARARAANKNEDEAVKAARAKEWIP